MRLLKPEILEDIRPRSRAAFRAAEQRINLSYRRVRRIPLIELAKWGAAAAAAAVFFLGSASAPIDNQTHAADSAATQERAQLEAQLKDLETQMDAYQSQIAGYRKQGNSLKSEINQLNVKVSQLNAQIRAINITLAKLDQEIGDTEDKIAATQTSIGDNRAALGNLLKTLYASERASLLEVFLANPKLSDFFSDVQNISVLQDSLRITILQIQDLQGRLKDQKDQLSLARADAATVKEYRAAQESQTQDIKNQKAELLTVTKGQESKYQALLKQTKETADRIRSRIFELLGGGELSFEQAYEYAKLAGNATGVRPALILAVLDRESALGKNVGKCAYSQAMSPSNQALFLSLLQQLNVAPDSITVSCANRDGIYGGAMGPAQFIPSTWNLYADRISKITGRTPANPWNNADAFAATALYLADAGAAGNATLAKERTAAAKYYAGARWRSYLWTYGQAVVNRAQSFQDDIDTITG